MTDRHLRRHQFRSQLCAPVGRMTFLHGVRHTCSRENRNSASDEVSRACRNRLSASDANGVIAAPEARCIPDIRIAVRFALQAAAKKSSRKMRFSGMPFARSKVETDSHITG